jgi:hypothetical protein
MGLSLRLGLSFVEISAFEYLPRLHGACSQ